MGTQASIKLGLQEDLQGSTQLQAEDGEESIVLREDSTKQFPSVEVQVQEITKASASGKSEAGEEKSSIPSRERYEVVSISVQEQTRGVGGNEAGSRHEIMIQEHVSARQDDFTSLGDGPEAVLQLKVEAVANDLGNLMDLCETSDLATCHPNLSTTSLSIESHRRLASDQIDLPGIAEETTSTQNGGLFRAGIIREEVQMSLVDVRPSLPCIDKKRERNLQANAAQESDPEEIQGLVVGSRHECNGFKRCMLIEMVNPSELDVDSEVLKMGNPVDLDVDMSPTHHEEQGNDILEATATRTSQPEAGEDMRVEAVANDLRNAMDLCQTSGLASCHMKLSTMSFPLESHQQSAYNQIPLHGIAEEVTSIQVGGLSGVDIMTEDEQESLVDVKPSSPCIDRKSEGNLQANAPRQTDPGDIQESVVDSKGGCTGVKISMSIGIVNPSEQDPGSEELKMGSPVNLDIDVPPGYQEEHGNDILEGTASGTSSQAGAGEDISIILRELSANKQMKIGTQG